MKLCMKLLLTANSVVIGLVYEESGNNFLWHNGWTEQPLMASKGTWVPYAKALNITMAGLVVISNQLGMPTRLDQFVKHFLGGETVEIKESNSSSSLKKAVIFAGSASKALISTSSLFSSVRDTTGGLTVPSIVAGTCLLGNFLAVLVTLVENHKVNFNLSKRAAFALALFVGTTYGASQECIYSNAIYNPLMLTKALAERPGWFNTDKMGFIIYALTAYPRLEFMIGSATALFKITKKVAGSARGKVNEAPPTGYQKWRGFVAASYRSMAAMAAIFGFFYSISGNNLPESICLALFLGALAAPGLAAVLYPVKEEPVLDSGEELPETVSEGLLRWLAQPSQRGPESRGLLLNSAAV